MALFFDAEWFSALLAARNLSRSDVAHALGLSEAEIGEIWKDQRELAPQDVAALAALLGAGPSEVAEHAGVSTRAPEPSPISAAALGETLAEMSQRLARVERTLAEIKALILDLRRGSS